MTQFRLLHLTDLHFSKRERGADARERFNNTKSREILELLHHVRRNGFFSGHDNTLSRLVAEFAYDRRAELDAIVISGDLATTGTMDDLLAALEFLEAVPVVGSAAARGKGTLAASGLRIYVLPGNHDRYLNELGDTGGKEFENVFKAYWSRGAHAQAHMMHLGEAGLGIVLIDFSLRDNLDSRPGAFSHLGQGKVYDDALDEAIELTGRLRDRTNGVIWVVHFPPEVASGEPKLDLIDGQKLVEGAEKCGVLHVLAGHIHKHIRYTPPGRKVSVLCANTPCSTTLSGSYGFQILDIDVAASPMAVREEVYRWNQVRKDFVRRVPLRRRSGTARRS
jgi:3',5'-cyclic AMP phosphodiesterase CpdA